ncbi:MAG: hypothetical protein D6808_06085 [Candidatus Dadabacteria bacterium]|nr:MAG: hypothetical protein D6808_06085 [Candidatus Dadabacteria bacterium]
MPFLFNTSAGFDTSSEIMFALYDSMGEFEMADEGFLVLFLVALYFTIVLLIGFPSAKGLTPSGYLIAERKEGLFQTTASITAVIGGVLLVEQASLAYDLGFSAIWFWIGFALGMICLGMSAGKIKEIADKRGFITISQYFHEKFDFKANALAASILFKF